MRALSTMDYTIMKLVHQVDIEYGISKSTHSSFITLASATWSLFRSPAMWVKLDAYYILGEECQLFKFIRKFRYLGMEDLA